jgi:hypothetical protein
MLDQAALPDRIYEAAILPELWPSVLSHMAQVTGSIGTALFVTDNREISR